MHSRSRARPETGQNGECLRAKAPVGAVSFRANTFETFNDVKYNSLDPYARTRSVYYQTRLGLLEDRVADSASSAVSEDEFDSLFEESD